MPAVLALAWLLPAPCAWAEMSGGDYLPQGVIQSQAERERAQARIEAERRAEAERAAMREAERAAERIRHAAWQARRPPLERLLEQRCSGCHDLAALARIGHTWLGWHLVILRMRWLNGASISFGESVHLAEHLATRQPARGPSRWLEMLAFTLPAVVLLGLLARRIWRWRDRWRRGCGRG